MFILESSIIRMQLSAKQNKTKEIKCIKTKKINEVTKVSLISVTPKVKNIMPNNNEAMTVSTYMAVSGLATCAAGFLLTKGVALGILTIPASPAVGMLLLAVGGALIGAAIGSLIKNLIVEPYLKSKEIENNLFVSNSQPKEINGLNEFA